MKQRLQTLGICVCTQFGVLQLDVVPLQGCDLDFNTGTHTPSILSISL